MADIYEFCVRGSLGEVMRSALPELTAQTDPPHSLLVGPAPDITAVTRALDVLTSHGIPVTGIRIDRADTGVSAARST